jgi:hypothetical protein
MKKIMLGLCLGLCPATATGMVLPLMMKESNTENGIPNTTFAGDLSVFASNNIGRIYSASAPTVNEVLTSFINYETAQGYTGIDINQLDISGSVSVDSATIIPVS